MRPGIAGIGACVPNHKVTNFDLEKIVDTTDEWIRQRTGIIERRILAEGEEPAQLGIVAAKGAIESAGLSPKQIDLIITATNLPEMPIPGSSPFIKEGLLIDREIPFFDLIAGCTGFVYALKVAADMITAGSYKNVLVIGVEALSRFTDWNDRSTCVLFGDGGGAVVVSPLDGNRGILASHLAADSSKWDLLRMEGGGVRFPASEKTLKAGLHYLRMEGGGVFKNAVEMMEAATFKALEKAEVSKEEIDWVVPHQANIRIIRSFAKRFDIPMERVLVNIDKYANTSTASIPLALDEASKDGRLKEGDLVVLNAFGAGVTYGAIVLRW
jgi:3-oxoacyl-[acyl-carrier-protein] synthase-3